MSREDAKTDQILKMWPLAGLRHNQIVDVQMESVKMVMEPVTAPKYDLDEMLALMTPDTFPDELDFGPAQGGEAW